MGFKTKPKSSHPPPPPLDNFVSIGKTKKRGLLDNIISSKAAAVSPGFPSRKSIASTISAQFTSSPSVRSSKSSTTSEPSNSRGSKSVVINSNRNTVFRHKVFHNGEILYEWQQNPKFVTIYYPTPNADFKVFCNIESNLVQLGTKPKGLPCKWFLSHATGGQVNEELSSWKQCKQHCRVVLAKENKGSTWSRALRDTRVDDVQTTFRERPRMDRTQSQADIISPRAKQRNSVRGNLDRSDNDSQSSEEEELLVGRRRSSRRDESDEDRPTMTRRSNSQTDIRSPGRMHGSQSNPRRKMRSNSLAGGRPLKSPARKQRKSVRGNWDHSDNDSQSSEEEELLEGLRRSSRRDESDEDRPTMTRRSNSQTDIRSPGRRHGSQSKPRRKMRSNSLAGGRTLKSPAAKQRNSVGGKWDRSDNDSPRRKMRSNSTRTSEAPMLFIYVNPNQEDDDEEPGPKLN